MMVVGEEETSPPPLRSREEEDEVIHVLPPPPPPPPTPPIVICTPSTKKTKDKRSIEEVLEIDEKSRLPLCIGSRHMAAMIQKETILKTQTQTQQQETAADAMMAAMMSSIQICDDGNASDFSLQANLDYRAKQDQKTLDAARDKDDHHHHHLPRHRQPVVCSSKAEQK